MEKLKARLESKRREIKARQDRYPTEWLGRSLAYNPYMPRPLESHLRREGEALHRVVEIPRGAEITQLESAQEAQRSGARALLVSGEAERLSGLRRYTALPLIYEDFIIDSYQLLEALVYGADGVWLEAEVLGLGELRELVSYSERLGLSAVVEAGDKRGLTKAIASGARILALDEVGLVELCPASKVILGRVIAGEESGESWATSGADGVVASG